MLELCVLNLPLRKPRPAISTVGKCPTPKETPITLTREDLLANLKGLFVTQPNLPSWTVYLDCKINSVSAGKGNMLITAGGDTSHHDPNPCLPSKCNSGKVTFSYYSTQNPQLSATSLHDKPIVNFYCFGLMVKGKWLNTFQIFHCRNQA